MSSRISSIHSVAPTEYVETTMTFPCKFQHAFFFNNLMNIFRTSIFSSSYVCHCPFRYTCSITKNIDIIQRSLYGTTLFIISFGTYQIHFGQTRDDGRPQMFALFLIRTFVDSINKEKRRLTTLSGSIKHFRFDTAYMLVTVLTYDIVTSTCIVGFFLDGSTLEFRSVFGNKECTVSLLFYIQLFVFIVGCVSLLNSISKCPVFVYIVGISNWSIVAYAIFYISLHNKFATQVLRHIVIIQMQLQQFQIS